MEQMVIYGGNKLKGTVRVKGAKNDVLSIMAASLLAETGITTVNNVPGISDVFTMIEILKSLNVSVDFDEEINQLKIDATKSIKSEANSEFTSRMRHSVVILGPILVRTGRVKVSMPGGCAIGKRPLDLHLKGFQTLGTRIVDSNNSYIEVMPDGLKGRNIYMDFPSVGATQNIMMVAVRAKGVTLIKNVAREPEVVSLANFLNKMGAKVVGAGTPELRIEGVGRLCATEHTVIPDRIEAGTFMIAAAMIQGDVLIENAKINHNVALVHKLGDMGVIVSAEKTGVRVIGPKVIKPVNIMTAPYPGFPTDLQPQISALLMIADGPSFVTETIFENRFQHLKEMQSMNGDYEIYKNIANIKGNSLIQGADVAASDLRAAAALVLLGLCASGVTRVSNLEHLDRGYSKFHDNLKMLGAKLERMTLEI